jgi:hypothetical protein
MTTTSVIGKSHPSKGEAHLPILSSDIECVLIRGIDAGFLKKYRIQNTWEMTGK